MEHPTWWGWRERWASRLGEIHWLGWYIAPRASRERWAAIAAGFSSPDPAGEIATALHILQRDYGFRLVDKAGGGVELIGPERYARRFGLTP